jgi:hypothetical protein
MRAHLTNALRALDDALGSMQQEPPDLESAGRGILAARDALRGAELALEMPPEHLRLDQALAALTHVLATCTEERAAAVRTILRRGAGLIGLPDGAVLSAPAGLVPERRELWVTLADTLRIDAVGVSSDWRDSAEWTPVRAGQWESVLATLLIQRDWEQVERTAAELREEWPEEPGLEAPEPAWRRTVREVADILDATKHTFKSRQVARARALLEGLLR